MANSVDLLVVGAGAIGLTSAWRAAQRGLSVVVVERDRPGAGASTVAAGLLSPSEPEEWRGDRGAFNLAAMADWPLFAAELEAAADTTIGYRRDGAVRLALSAAELPDLDVAAAAMTAAGVEHERLDADGVRAAEPGLRGALAALLIPGDARVATDRLVAALAVAAERAGVRILTGVEPLASLREDDRFAGVHLDSGPIHARLTVIAAGAWSATAPWIPAAARPALRPLLGEYVLLQGDPERPVTRRVIRSAVGSTAPRERGHYWIGTTVREAGYAPRVRAGSVLAILDHWTRVLPGLAELEVLHVGAGLRPKSADGLPIVGPSAIAGLALATGHGREGIIHAPLTGAAVAALAAGEPIPPLLHPFSPDRPGAIA
jgi:glycine oxidase